LLVLAFDLKGLCGNLFEELLSRVQETAEPHGQARSPSVQVAVPPHSEAWRARSGGATWNPLIPRALGEQIAARGSQ